MDLEIKPFSKGFVLTLSVFLIATALLFFNKTVFDRQLSLETPSELVLLREAGQQYRDIARTILELDLSGQKKSVMERGLPFSYSGDQNMLFVSQDFPIFQTKLATFFNAINGFRIFDLNQALQHLSRDFVLDINTSKDANWGGTETAIRFLVLPACTQLYFYKSNTSFSPSTSTRCLTPYSAGNFQRADVNIILLDIREDYNSLTCNGGACPQNAFDPLNPNPYYFIQFSTASCPLCTFVQQTVSLHHPTGADYNVFLSCTVPGCFSKPVQLLFNNFLTAIRDSNETLKLNLRLQFDRNIDSFQSLDINFAVQVPQHGIVRVNDPSKLN